MRGPWSQGIRFTSFILISFIVQRWDLYLLLPTLHWSLHLGSWVGKSSTFIESCIFHHALLAPFLFLPVNALILRESMHAFPTNLPCCSPFVFFGSCNYWIAVERWMVRKRKKNILTYISSHSSHPLPLHSGNKASWFSCQYWPGPLSGERHITCI